MNKGTERKRLDVLMVEKGLAESRAKAQALILAGLVYAGERRLEKPGMAIEPSVDISVRERLRYASRGGLKLEHALDTFRISVEGAIAADVGASTGGFTDCLLQHGAARVYAIDVGYGQLDWRLRSDARVVVMDRTNVRYLDRLPEPVDLVVIDVSFISLELVLPVVVNWLRPQGRVIALIKPQFEAGKGQVGKGGVVRDSHVHDEVIQKVRSSAESVGLIPRGITKSPILGPAGNVEFLALYERP